MKIKVIASHPVDIQDDILELVGKEFETVSYREFDKATREEMRALKEVAVRIGRNQYILNKSEYKIIKEEGAE